jgi:L-lactate utilization protein LutC
MQTNNRRYLAATVASAALSFSAGAALADTALDSQQAHEIIQQFATTLKGELQQAMKSGGPTNAVGVCKERAPAIAASLAEQTGWEVGRTSLKMRNAALNTPDIWEQRVLKQFEDRKAAGQPVAGMTYAEVVETDDGTAYRYMQAIPTEQVCLACHGGNIEPGLAESIDQAYPDDQARGYAVGDIRGAFTLSKPL